MQRQYFALLFAVAMSLLSLVTSLSAQDVLPPPAAQPQPVEVGIYLNPPFMMKNGETYSGLAFDLFEDLARRGNLRPTFSDYETPQALLAAAAAGTVDIAVGNLTITRERMGDVDFTFPWHDGGLRILVDDKTDMGLGDIWGALGDAGHLRAFLWLGFFLVAATILLTLFDRRFDEEFPRTWFAGFVESFYHVMSITTSGSTSRKLMFGAFGKLFAAFWLVFGVVVLAYVTSAVTSVMTAAAVGSGINDVNDLGDRTIGVLSGGASELYARDEGLSVRAYPTLEGAEAALRDGQVDAVIADAMVLEYFVHHHADAGLEVVGPLFDPQKYGFATRPGSPLTRSLSLDLLSAHEDGTTERLRGQYLGIER